MTSHEIPKGAADFERLLRANRLLMLAAERIVRAEDIPTLLQDLCNIAILECFPMAWVGRKGPHPEDPLTVAASAGDTAGYAAKVQATWGRAPLGRGPIGEAIRQGKTIVNRDFQTNPAMQPWRDIARRAGFASSIGIPLVVSSEVWGIFSVYAREPDGFDGWESELFEALGRTIAAGVEHRLGQDRLDAMMEDVVTALTKALETRDHYTVGHQSRVAALCVEIGRELGMAPDALRGLRIAALLHDIGKIAVPPEILNKIAPLTPEELGQIRQHVEAGHAIIRHIDFPWPVADAVLQHHERLDGSGYPQGLAGDKIGLEARILAVADLVDAMSKARSYRPALGVQAARQTLQGQRGQTLDPGVVDACLAVLDRQGEALMG